MKLLRHLLVLHSPYTNFGGCRWVFSLYHLHNFSLAIGSVHDCSHEKIIYEPVSPYWFHSYLIHSFFWHWKLISYVPWCCHYMMTNKNHHSHFEKQIKPECKSRREKLNSLERSILLFHLSNYKCYPLLSWDWTEAISHSQEQDESSRGKTQPPFWKKIPLAPHPTMINSVKMKYREAQA